MKGCSWIYSEEIYSHPHIKSYADDDIDYFVYIDNPAKAIWGILRKSMYWPDCTLTISQLLGLFEKASGSDFASDKALLSK